MIGCTLLVAPVFFPPEAWVRQPTDWRPRTQTPTRYNLTTGEGHRVWEECLAVARELDTPVVEPSYGGVARPTSPRYGDPLLVKPRLGQKTFRVAVLDAYGRACAVTDEHSLPALDAGHILPYEQGGPHEVSNGILLRADLHRLFDKGYVTVAPEMRLVVGNRLRAEYRNGRTYYPLAGKRVSVPRDARHRPDPELLRWHNEEVFVG